MGGIFGGSIWVTLLLVLGLAVVLWSIFGGTTTA